MESSDYVIYTALINNDYAFIKRSINYGLNVNMIVFNSPLIFHVTNFTMFELLVNNGANIFAVNKDNECLMRYASDIRIVEYLVKKSKHTEHYIWFINSGLFYAYDMEKIRYLLDNGADAKYVTYDGLSVLHTVINPEIADMYIKLGVKVNAKTMYGNTPLHMNLPHDVMKVLIIYGADVNATNVNGDTPLHHIVQYSNGIENVKLLLECGANESIKNNKNETPYDLAIKHGNKEIASLLLNA